MSGLFQRTESDFAIVDDYIAIMELKNSEYEKYDSYVYDRL